MSSGVSLYYPYIHISEEGWLKRSLLYWDRVRRIVPDGFEPNDNSDCYNAKQAELLIATSPTPYLSETAQRFRAKIPALVEEITRRAESFEVDDPEVAARDYDRRIHIEKMETWLRSFLVERELVQIEGKWIVSHPDIADWYMTCLATVMSETIGSPVVTDLRKTNAVGEYFAHANPGSGEEHADRGVAMLRLHIPFPNTEALARVPFSEILDFRENYSDERWNLREAIEELMKDVPTISDENNLRDHLHDKQARLDKALRDQRKAADRFYAKTIPSLLQISAPTGVLALAGRLGAPPLTLTALGAGTVALLALAWWAKFMDEEAAVKAQPYQYLLSLEERFGPP